MDELKLVLSTKFMRTLVTKILSKAIYKKTGYRVDIQLNEMKVKTCDGRVSIHIDMDGEMNGDDLIDILKTKDLM